MQNKPLQDLKQQEQALYHRLLKRHFGMGRTGMRRMPVRRIHLALALPQTNSGSLTDRPTGLPSASPGSSPGARAARFAQAVQRRYAAGASFGRITLRLAVGFIYLSSGPRPVIGPSVRSRTPQLALRLALTLLTRPGAAVTALQRAEPDVLPAPLPPALPQVALRPASVQVPDRPGAPSAAGSPPAPGPAAASTTPAASASVGEILHIARQQARIVLTYRHELARRMEQRGEREPMVAPPGPRPSTYPSAAPAPLHLRRSRPAPAARPESQPGAPNLPGTIPWPGEVVPQPRDLARASAPHRTAASGEPFAAPDFVDPAQLGRLADQVVRIIDNRIIARSERLGRI